jgi:hypothetical protein
VAFSRDGTRLATSSDDWTAKLWDAASGEELFTLKGHAGAVTSATFNRDGTRLATASRDQTVKLWDAVLGQELRILRMHTGSVWSVAFSADGSRLASASDDRTVVLRDARPVSPEVKAEALAVSRLECLFRKPLPRNEVVAAIERDGILGESARTKALEFAERFQEETDSQKYYAAAWHVLRHPYSNVFICRLALAQMQAACQRAPENDLFRMALGVAQYRQGQFDEQQISVALATLGKCPPDHPTTLAFSAMAQHQLGQQEVARVTFTRLQEVIKEDEWSKDPDAQSFFREAMRLIDGGASRVADELKSTGPERKQP